MDKLARLNVAEQGGPASLAQDTAFPRLDGVAFVLAPEAKPEAVGGQVARAVFGGLSQ